MGNLILFRFMKT